MLISFSSFFPEPGYYEDGSFGIRIENVVLVVPTKPKVGPKHSGVLFTLRCLTPEETVVLLPYQ